jgi:hypothetical protein
MAQGLQANLRTALKRVAVALKEADVPFALAGGYAVWARGGPEPDHDVDFLVSEEDQERAAQLLERAGLHVERPPEDWLFKVRSDDVTVDVLYRAAGSSTTGAALDDATEVEVLSVWMPVLSATELMVQKASALNERYCDLGYVLPTARALREQVDWERVRAATAGNPFAEVFLVLLDKLEVVPKD